MKAKKGGAKHAFRKASTESNNERLSHKEALTKKYDVITMKMANNIWLAELPLAKGSGK